VIVALANYLAQQGHRIHLYPLIRPASSEDYAAHKFHPKVKIGQAGELPERVLITSPHSIHLARHKRSVVHLQMLEDLFRPGDSLWAKRCQATYTFPGRLLSISGWNIHMLKTHWNRQGPISYIGNGVDYLTFPVNTAPRKYPDPMVLVEGWNAYNPTKDFHRVAPQIALRLKEKGVKVVAYGLHPPLDYLSAFDEYYARPDLKTLNELYEQAWVLLKASRLDARSCSPVEAMTKGTPTFRLIEEGDDDLVNGKTAIRLSYNDAVSRLDETANELLNLLENQSARETLAQNGYKHLQTVCDWDVWGSVVMEALRDPNGTGPLAGEIPLS
jgi:hypothetical protein